MILFVIELEIHILRDENCGNQRQQKKKEVFVFSEFLDRIYFWVFKNDKDNKDASYERGKKTLEKFERPKNLLNDEISWG